MADETIKPEPIPEAKSKTKLEPKTKRLSKSERTHRRRMKQAARKPGASGS